MIGPVAFPVSSNSWGGPEEIRKIIFTNLCGTWVISCANEFTMKQIYPVCICTYNYSKTFLPKVSKLFTFTPFPLFEATVWVPVVKNRPNVSSACRKRRLKEVCVRTNVQLQKRIML